MPRFNVYVTKTVNLEYTGVEAATHEGALALATQTQCGGHLPYNVKDEGFVGAYVSLDDGNPDEPGFEYTLDDDGGIMFTEEMACNQPNE